MKCLCKWIIGYGIDKKLTTNNNKNPSKCKKNLKCLKFFLKIFPRFFPSSFTFFLVVIFSITRSRDVKYPFCLKIPDFTQCSQVNKVWFWVLGVFLVISLFFYHCCQEPIGAKKPQYLKTKKHPCLRSTNSCYCCLKMPLDPCFPGRESKTHIFLIKKIQNSPLL